MGDDFPHCGSTEVVVAPEMAGTLSPYLPSVPQYSFWSVPGDPEGLVYRASSEAATPQAGRNFPVLVVVIAEMTESYYIIFPELLVTFSSATGYCSLRSAEQ